MKRFENILVGIVILFLSLHLFVVHSKLLFHINPDKLIQELTYSFNASLFSQELIVSTLSALAYSLITAAILTVFVRFRKVFLISIVAFAILDGAGVLIYYNVGIKGDLFLITGAVYYSLYTLFIVISVGLFRRLTYSSDEKLHRETDNSMREFDIHNIRDVMQEIFKENNETMQPDLKVNKTEGMILDDKILYLKNEKGKSQQAIATELGISQSKVSRTLAKYN